MKRLVIYTAALCLLSLPAAAQAGPLRAIGRGLKAVAGKIIHGVGHAARGIRGC